jgi:DNA phosphorothioation-dependent restriction protein DptG
MKWYHIVIVIGIILIIAYFIKLFFNSRKAMILENKLIDVRTEYTREISNIIHESNLTIIKVKEKHKKQIQELENWYNKNETWIDEKNKEEFKKCLEDFNYTGSKLDQYINSSSTSERNEKE